MKRKILLAALALPLILLNPITGQSKNTDEVVMTNHWVKKFKKLKSDLEDKAGYVKTSENISEADKKIIKKSYLETSKRLEMWLDHLVTTIETKDGQALQQLSEGNIDQELKEELLEIFSYYSNDFQLHFEEITGQEAKMVVSHTRLMSECEAPNAQQLNNRNDNIQRDFLISNVKKPLQPAAWNSLF